MSPPSRPVSRSASRAGGVLADLVEEITNRLQAGETVNVEAYAALHPEHAEELRKLIPTLGALAAWSGGSGTAGGEPTAGTLGDYRILREVGRGGMGVVYEAEQVSLGRRVALKVLPFAATMDPRRLTRFHNEARAAASLEHPHIVPVYGVGSERGVHFYAMKLIDGRSLAEFLRDREAEADPFRTEAGPTKPGARDGTARDIPDHAYFKQVARIGAEAADALEYAHSMGVVHRDVKPANLMLDARGHLWVADFGLARTGQGDLTMTGDVMGTLRYMSPEQALARHGLVDHRTDVYSLGLTLYELLTHRPAVGGKDRQEIISQIAFEESIGPRKVVPEVPVDLETVVLKAMAKAPQDRYATAGELAADLRRFLDDRPVQARRPTVFKLVALWGRRRVGLAWAVGVGLLLGVVALGVGSLLLWREKERVKHALAEKEQETKRADAHFSILSAGMPHDVLREVYDEKWSDMPEVAALRLAVSARMEKVYMRLKDEGTGAPKLSLQAGWLLQDLGEFHLARWEFARAEALFRQALAIHSDLAEAHPEDTDQRSWYAAALVRLGRSLIAAGKRREAREHLVVARKLVLILWRQRQDDWREWIALVGFMTECPDEGLRDTQEALRAAEWALEMDPKSEESWYWLGVAQYRAKQWPAARASLLRAAETSRNDPSLAYYLAATFGRLGEEDKARAYLKWGDQLVTDRFGGYAKYQYQVKRAQAAAVLGLQEDPKPGLRLPSRPPSPP
ncbi:MAG: protein kinase [Gemmataceae bacterium]